MRVLEDRKINFAVPTKSSRIRIANSTSTVYDAGIPRDSFVRIQADSRNADADACQPSISGPELLFAELAESMHPLEHLMLGHELCGTFSRDASDPYNGPTTYGLQPVTSVDKIRSFLASAKHIVGIDAARTSAAYLNDNAWSPTESLVAALLRLPVDSLGFDFGELVLNPRKNLKMPLPGSKGSRVPDIVIAGTPVGVNYDGAVHLDLESIVDAARELEAHPEIAQTQTNLSRAVKDVREKVLDDIRRNRELAAGGLAVFPILKEDLYVQGGIDQVVAQLVETMEHLSDRSMKEQRRILKLKKLSAARWRMILSLLPGQHERNVNVGRFIGGYKLSDSPPEHFECMIEF